MADGYGLNDSYKTGVKERAGRIAGGVAGVADQVKSVLAELKSQITPTMGAVGAGMQADTQAQTPTDRGPSIIGGAAKAIAGGLGAVPTAIYKTAEQFPAGVGKIIGAVPKNPADYGSNPSLDLMREGIGEVGTGVRDIGSKARTGLMSAFGLVEPTNIPNAAEPMAPSKLPTATVPAPSPTPIPNATANGSTEQAGGISPETFAKMQEVGRRAVAQSAPSGGLNYDVTKNDKGEFVMTPKGVPEIRETDQSPLTSTMDLRKQYAADAERTMAGVDRSRGERAVREANAKIDAQIERMENNPGNRLPGGGLGKNTKAAIARLREAQLNAAVNVEGHGVTERGNIRTTEATRAGHGVTRAGQALAARERVALERDKLSETTRYHDILSMNAKDKMANDKFMREEATKLRKDQGEANLMKTYGMYENALGEKGTNPAIAMFKLIDSGYDVNSLSKQWQATASQVKEGFRAFAMKAKAENPKLTPAQIKALYYDELRGAK